MKNQTNPGPSSAGSPGPLDTSQPQRGYLTKGETPGQIYVTVNGSKPLAASNLSMIDDPDLLKPENQGLEVALLFENGDLTKPMIISARGHLIQKILQETMKEELKKIPLNVLFNGHHIELDARKDLVLRSGQGKITITNKGVIRIEGVDIEIVSHGENRIKGSRIELN